jgi:cytochrome c556
MVLGKSDVLHQQQRGIIPMRKHSATSTLVMTAAVLGLALAVVAAPGAASPAAAQDPAALVLVRQDVMKANGGRLKAIAGFLKGDAGTAEEAAALAMQVSIMAGAIPMLFPEGTSTEDSVPKNRAKPEIWKDWDKFQAAAKNLSEQAANLSEVLQSGDKDAAGAQLQMTGKTGCGGCHESFRVPENS